MSKPADDIMTSVFSETAKRFINWLHEFVSGTALSWTYVPYILRRRKETKNLFMLALILNIRGLSHLSSRYRLWLLLEVIPQILYWQSKLLPWDDSRETTDLKHLGH